MLFSIEETAIMGAISVAFIVMWYFFEHENKQNSFLERRLNKTTEEEKNKKSKKELEKDKELENLNSQWTYKQVRMFSLICGLCLFIILSCVGAIPFGVFFFIISFAAPNIYIAYLKDRRVKLFQEQLPDALNQFVAILKSGQTQTQAFRDLGEYPYPLGNEFKKVYTDMDTGASIEDALNDFCKRMPVADLKLLTIGLIVSKSVSPTVAITTINIVANTIMQRTTQKKSAKTAVMQGKMTTYFLAALPLFCLAGMMTVNPEYIMGFLAVPTGKLAVGFALVLNFVGFTIANKITNTDNVVKY